MENIKAGEYVKCIHKHVNTGDHLTLNKKYRVIGIRKSHYYPEITSGFIIQDNYSKIRHYRIHNSQFEKAERDILLHEYQVVLLLREVSKDSVTEFRMTLPYIPELLSVITINEDWEGVPVSSVKYVCVENVFYICVGYYPNTEHLYNINH